MPYIEQAQRAVLDADPTQPPRSVGELNYLITQMINMWWVEHGQSYQTHNEIVGVLECVKQEWYRRMAVPYEDMKCQTNGDVYG